MYIWRSPVVFVFLQNPLFCEKKQRPNLRVLPQMVFFGNSMAQSGVSGYIGPQMNILAAMFPIPFRLTFADCFEDQFRFCRNQGKLQLAETSCTTLNRVVSRFFIE